ncbi:TPA: tail assembly protein [Salmonella enterica]|nr:tail assembly protein [Salmonella enterica]
MATTDAFSMAAPPVVRICLYGDLQRFGKRFGLSIKTAAEGIHALEVQLPGFRQKMSDGWYQVRIAGRDVDEASLSARLYEPLLPGAVIHIVPRMEGAKRGGFFQVIAGVALIGLAWWNPAGWLGAAAVSGLYGAGASMVLGGLAQMLTPVPKTPAMHQADNGKENPYFSSLDNMAAQGNPLPVLYGEMQIGSRVISQMLSTRDESSPDKVVSFGRKLGGAIAVAAGALHADLSGQGNDITKPRVVIR